MTEELESVLICSRSMQTGANRLRAIAAASFIARKELAAMIVDKGFRQYDPAKTNNMGELAKYQIETSREEKAVAFFEARLPEGAKVEYLFRIINISSGKVIRTYTTDFVPLKSQKYLWPFDGRDYLDSGGAKPFAEEGFYAGQIQLRCLEQTAIIQFSQSLRVVHRAARTLVMSSFISDIQNVETSLGNSVVRNLYQPSAVATTNILEKYKLFPFHWCNLPSSTMEAARFIFLNAGFVDNYADFLFIATPSDLVGRLLVTAKESNSESTLFDPLLDSAELKWINTPRWVLLTAANCLALHTSRCLTREELIKALPVAETKKIPNGKNILATCHAGAHWYDCIKKTGLRGLLGYWGPVPSENYLYKIYNIFFTLLHKGVTLLAAWKQANSAFRQNWAALARDSAAGDSLALLAGGLGALTEPWRYWDDMQEGQPVETAFREANQYSRNNKADTRPEFHPFYDADIAAAAIPEKFDTYEEEISPKSLS